MDDHTIFDLMLQQQKQELERVLECNKRQKNMVWYYLKKAII